VARGLVDRKCGVKVGLLLTNSYSFLEMASPKGARQSIMLGGYNLGSYEILSTRNVLTFVNTTAIA